jgi:hypothetical protein
MNNGLERMWKEAVAAQFRVLPQNLPGGDEEDHDNPQSG